MSGTFNRLRYDQSAYREEVDRSVGSGLYRLDSNFSVNAQKCFAPYGPRGAHDAAVAVGQQIDVDSLVRGVNKINTKSNAQQMPDSVQGYSKFVNNDCSSELEPEYTRFTYPSYELKGVTVSDMHLSYPLKDPQCQIFENFETNTRLEAKDNHRAIWQIPMNQTNALPTERLEPGKSCSMRLNCNLPYKQ